MDLLKFIHNSHRGMALRVGYILHIGIKGTYEMHLNPKFRIAPWYSLYTFSFENKHR